MRKKLARVKSGKCPPSQQGKTDTRKLDLKATPHAPPNDVKSNKEKETYNFKEQTEEDGIAQK
jgi:hypothetical protein